METKNESKIWGIYEVVFYEADDFFSEGWYVLQLDPKTRQVSWVSESFQSENEAHEHMEHQIENE